MENIERIAMETIDKLNVLDEEYKEINEKYHSYIQDNLKRLYDITCEMCRLYDELEANNIKNNHSDAEESGSGLYVEYNNGKYELKKIAQ